MDRKTVRIGTRGSRLALIQAALVEKALAAARPGLRTELVILRTKGDRIQDKPLSQVGQKGVFASELEEALLDGRIDLAVHSGKDLPVRLAEGLDILAVLPRADARDMLVLPARGPEQAGGGRTGEDGGEALSALAALPEGAVIGTGSLRRQLYGKRFCPQACFRLIRGNVDTRLKKLEDGGYDGLILAKAGLDRLGIPERERNRFRFLALPEERFLPAACQGIIAVEGRCEEKEEIVSLLGEIDDPLTRLAFETERRALLRFGADCSAPAAAFCRTARKDGERRLELSVMYAGREASGAAGEKDCLSLADRLCEEVRKEPGKVWLVGAGCGGPELITVKGLSLIRGCDVLLYDSLAAKELIHETKPGCERIDVGKRYGGKVFLQGEIHALMIRRAKEGKTVVRLKGGDPYVFGRGGEEMLALMGAGIPCEEVPGISSAFAAPAAAGIPVTHRGMSRSVTVMTASSLTGGGERLTETDYGALARLSGTLVILMGMHHLKELTDLLLEEGMPPGLPAAVVMEGATERQRCVRAPLGELAREACLAGLAASSAIVIGRTAALELPEMTFPEAALFPDADPENEGALQAAGSLCGVRVGVTGTKDFAKRLSDALRIQGAQTLDLSFLETVSAGGPLPDLDPWSWLVFTSPNGVRLFLEKMREGRRDLRTLAGKRIAAIGPGPGAALAGSGLYCDLMPKIHDAVHLGKILAEQMGEREKALLFRSETGSPALLRELSRGGKEFLDFSLYGLREDPERKKEAFRMLKEQPLDYLLFGSASGVKSFLDGLEECFRGKESLEAPASGLPALPWRAGCIGPWCRKAWEEETGRPGRFPAKLPEAFMAEEFSIDGLVRAVAADWRTRRPENVSAGAEDRAETRQKRGDVPCRDFAD